MTTCWSCRSLLATLTALVLAVVLLPDPELGLRELDLSSLSIPAVDANSVAAEVGLTHGATPLCSEEYASGFGSVAAFVFRVST